MAAQSLSTESDPTMHLGDWGGIGRRGRSMRSALAMLTALAFLMPLPAVMATLTPDGGGLGGHLAHIAYDAQSNPSVITTRDGRPIRLEYDDLDRVTKLTGPEGDITMAYDAAGNLLTANGYNGSGVALTHDALDRVTQVVQTLPNGYSAAIGYSLDANGNRTRMTTPWGGFDYTYDMLDRVTSITNPFGQVVTFTYDPLSRRTRMSYPNGTQSSYAYDAAGRIGQVLHQRVAGQTAIAFTNYVYDQAGNRTGVTDANGSHTFSYDQLDRLKTAGHSGGSTLPSKDEDFDYDPIGNRTADASRTGYEYDAANRLVGDSSYTYTSDAEGNITSRTDRLTGETLTFVYDSGHHLIEVRNAVGAIATYKYNPEGLRVEKNVGGVIRRYVYEKSRILAILDANNALLALYTTGPGIDSPLIARRGGQDYFYHADALGNITALTDAAGNTVETVEYQAFGRAVIKDALGQLHDQSTVGNELLYASRELDPETNLYYLRARHYDPDTGRFLQEDPVVSINQYAYADNNPILLTDPLGLFGVDDASDLAAGFGDTLTSGFGLAYLFGLKSGTEYVRDWMGTSGYVSGCSGWYTAGKIGGYAWGIAYSAALARAATQGIGRAVGTGVPSRIKGWTSHGLDRQLYGRDWQGVRIEAIEDAVNNPLKITSRVGSRGSTVTYEGSQASVTLNSDGLVVTTHAKGAGGFLWPR